VLAGVLCVGVISIPSYFRKDGFLNKGYLLPFDQIGELVRQAAEKDKALAIVDTFGVDTAAILTHLPPQVPIVLVDGRSSLAVARRKIREADPAAVLYLRGTRDLSAGQLNVAFEQELSECFERRIHYYVSYSQIDRWLMTALDWKECPTHVYQLAEFRRRAGPTHCSGDR